MGKQNAQAIKRGHFASTTQPDTQARSYMGALAKSINTSILE